MTFLKPLVLEGSEELELSLLLLDFNLRISFACSSIILFCFSIVALRDSIVLLSDFTSSFVSFNNFSYFSNLTVNSSYCI